MNAPSLGIRGAAVAAALLMTIASIGLIADYAYPPSHAALALLASRGR